MSDRSAAIGLASASDGAPPPNSSAAGLGDERPGDRLAQRERGERALGEPRALLQQRQHRLRHAVVEPGQGRGRRAIDAGDAQNLLDDVGLHLDVRPPRRNKHPPIFHAEAEAGQDRVALRARNVDAEQSLDLAIGEGNRTPRRDRIAGDDHARRLAAADRENEFGREIAAGDAEFGIDAALESIARVGHDSELAAGLGDILRVPQRALDQNVARRLVAAGMLAAHDSGDRFDAVGVGDDDHRSRRARRTCRRARARSRQRGRGARQDRP